MTTSNPFAAGGAAPPFQRPPRTAQTTPGGPADPEGDLRALYADGSNLRAVQLAVNATPDLADLARTLETERVGGPRSTLIEWLDRHGDG